MLRPVSEVADMETWLGLAGTRWSFFRCQKKAGAQRFIIDARVSNRHILRPPSGPLRTGEGLCHVEFQGAPEDAQNWFVGSGDIKNAFHQMRIPGWLQAFFALPAVLAPDVGYTGKTVDQKRPAPDSLIYAVTTTLPMGFFMGDVFLSRITARSREVLTFAATTLLHRCLVAKMAWDPLVSVGRLLTILGVLARGANCTNVHLARLIAGVQKAGSRYSRHIPCQRKCRDVLGFGVSPVQRVL